jgi:hypothetical protein
MTALNYFNKNLLNFFKNAKLVHTKLLFLFALLTLASTQSFALKVNKIYCSHTDPSTNKIISTQMTSYIQGAAKSATFNAWQSYDAVSSAMLSNTAIKDKKGKVIRNGNPYSGYDLRFKNTYLSLYPATPVALDPALATLTYAKKKYKATSFLTSESTLAADRYFGAEFADGVFQGFCTIVVFNLKNITTLPK